MTELPPAPGASEPVDDDSSETPAKRGLFAAIVAMATLVAMAGVVTAGFLWLEPAAVKRPSPVAKPESRPAPAAPSDEAVLAELEAQLDLFTASGSRAASARYDSYKAGVESGGSCQVGFAFEQDVASRKLAEAGAAEREVTLRTLAGTRGEVVAIGTKTAKQTNGNFSWFLLLVACPPTTGAA